MFGGDHGRWLAYGTCIADRKQGRELFAGELFCF